MSNNRLDGIQKALGYRFIDQSLLLRALTHKTYAHEEKVGFNERLEFLGDEILDACISAELFIRFPKATEGQLSVWRSHLIRTAALAEIGRKLGLGPALRLGKGEQLTGGRDKDKLLEDATEALFGALFLDSSFERCREVVCTVFEAHFDTLRESRVKAGTLYGKDAVSRLQEETQRRWKMLPEYVEVSSEGPDHARTFIVEVAVRGEALGRGSGRKVKLARRSAASAALETLSHRAEDGAGEDEAERDEAERDESGGEP